MVHFEDRCEICNALVHSYDYDYGYGEHSYGHQTHKPYEKRNIKVPEMKYGIDIIICLDCEKEIDKINEYVRKQRIEYLQNEIASSYNNINELEKEIKSLKESIPKIKEQIKSLKQKKKKLEGK